MNMVVKILRISFFVSVIFFLTQCRQAEEKVSLAPVSKNDKIIGIAIRGISLKEKELVPRLKVQLLKPDNSIPVLGDFRMEDGEVVFESVVPLTQGLKYEVLLDDTLLSEIEIPLLNTKPPALRAIYPSQDTLPENLLKMYFEFSAPMVEGSSLDHIILVSEQGDTLKGIFLDLKPELWNVEGNVLTLWLDPGRIKRNLIPNQQLGTPLKAGERYTVQVSQSWPGKNGLHLSKAYTKTFVTTAHDAESPEVSSWKIEVPKAGENEVLEIYFQQPLDYFLARETITIKSAEGFEIPGTFELGDEEKILRFKPVEPWKKGHFLIYAESRLEDLAGNNLNRPFDRNVETAGKKPEPFFTKDFAVE